MYSPVSSDGPVDILLAISDYHISGQSVGLNHTVNFGIPWLPGSHCNYGFLSFPYLENDSFVNFQGIQYLWVIPITEEERKFKIEGGAEALEKKFEETQLDYLNPHRLSVV